MTTEKINNRIKELEQEKGTLESEFQQIQNEFNRTTTERRTRFNQIEGAITELKTLSQSNGEMVVLPSDRTS